MDYSVKPKYDKRIMDWLNYHHLRYFWTVAKAGSLAQAAAKLHVSQPSISEQIHELETALGEKLFEREGRNNKLTDAGHVVLGYAEEIFTLGGEIISAVKQRPGVRTLRLYVGVADSLPKLVTSEILKPVLAMAQTVHIICREGKMDDLLGQLGTHRLDIILADEPASSSTSLKVFNHPLGETTTVFCASPQLARRLKRGFPRSLHAAPAFLPAENTAFRRTLETWFHKQQVKPRVLAEFEDQALMKMMAADAEGFIPLPTLDAQDAGKRYGLKVFGTSRDCAVHFYAIHAERRISHPAVQVIVQTAQARLKSQGLSRI